MAVGAGISAGGAYGQAAAQKDTLNYEATVNENNAQIAQYQATIAQHVGEQQEQSSRLRTSSLYGSQRAALAASGVDLGQGSATDVLASTRVMGERDVMTIRDNTAQRVWAAKTEAANLRTSAQASRQAASAISPGRAGATSLLLGAGQVYSGWYRNKYKGASEI